MTYYKYAEREANSQINWAEVSKGLSDTIAQIDKDRQAKKAAIDASTREDMKELADAPKGENTTASEWTINYANDMMNYRLSIDRLLKSGKMSLKDYQVAAQNSKDSTNLVFTLSKEYQDQYKVIMDRMRAGESSRLETEIAALNESFANISNTVPTINSTNGMVYLSNPEVGEDGVQKLGKNYVSLQALRNRVNAKIDKYDLAEGLSGAASKLGDYTISQIGRTNFRRTGVVTDISDPTLRDTYSKWEDATVKEVMSSGYRLASIMADNMDLNPKTGNQYRITMSKEEFDADKTGDVILMANENGSGVLVPEFKDGQKKDVEAFIKGQIKNFIDKKVEKNPFQEPDVYRPQQWEVEAGKAAKTQKAAAGYWQQLRWGNETQKRDAANIILGTPEAQQRGLYDISVSSDGKSLTLKYTKASGIPDRSIPLDKATSSKEWAGLGAEIHGITDATEALRAAGEGANKPFQPFSTGKLAGRDYTTDSGAYERFSQMVAAKPLKDLVKKDAAESTASQLNAAYSDLGFTFDFNESTLGTTDDVIVKYNGKKVGTVAVDDKEIGSGNIESLIRQTLKNPPAQANQSQGNSTVTGGNVR
jgi:hypothetical protein